MSRMSIKNIRKNWDDPEFTDRTQRELARRLCQSIEVAVNLAGKHHTSTDAALVRMCDDDAVYAYRRLCADRIIQITYRPFTEHQNYLIVDSITLDQDKLYDTFFISWNEEGDLVMRERTAEYRIHHALCQSDVSELALRFHLGRAQELVEYAEKAVESRESESVTVKRQRREALQQAMRYREIKRNQLRNMQAARTRQ